jgi:REP element-mobilizing transposase RayT
MAQRFTAAIPSSLKPALAAEVANGCSPQRQHWIRHLLHHRLRVSEATITSIRQDAQLFLDVVLNYSSQEKYLLHEFVLMPDHFHRLITPLSTLERALQLIKGSFSFRAKSATQRQIPTSHKKDCFKPGGLKQPCVTRLKLEAEHDTGCDSDVAVACVEV